MKVISVFVLAAAALLSGCITVQVDENGLPVDSNGTPKGAYYTASVEVISDGLIIDNDPLETTVKVSSQNIRARHIQFFGANSKIFVRGWLSKSGGEPSYDFYIITENDDDWLYPYALNFGDPVQSIRLNKIPTGSDVDCWRTNCDLTEQVYGDIPASALDYFLAESTPQVVPVRIKTRSGQDIDRNMNKNEVIAVVQAMTQIQMSSGNK